MPYKIFPVRKGGKVIGYKVGKKDRGIMDNGRRYLSDKPLSKKRADFSGPTKEKCGHLCSSQ